MIASGWQMILNPELKFTTSDIDRVGPGPAKLSGFIDYSIIILPEKGACIYHDIPSIEIAQRLRLGSFFVVETKAGPIRDHVPQIVWKMVVCAEQLSGGTIRGALTNGQEWIFLIAQSHSDGHRASYWMTESIKLVQGNAPDMIAGMLLYWIRHSFVQLQPHDWFEHQKHCEGHH